MTIADLPGLSTANRSLLMYVFTYGIAARKVKPLSVWHQTWNLLK